MLERTLTPEPYSACGPVSLGRFVPEVCTSSNAAPTASTLTSHLNLVARGALLHCEQRQGDGRGLGGVSGIVDVQMIAAVVGGT